MADSPRKRVRNLGVVVGEHPTGPYNAITDVAGVRVGHTTIQDGAAVNTGVTVSSRTTTSGVNRCSQARTASTAAER